MSAPWIEKYRPQTLDEVVGNTEAIKRLAAIASGGNMPHCILCGPPGTGKTTSIHCLARQMLGDAYKSAVLELNASDSRGIDVVRNKIKMFAQKKVTLPPGKHKIIVLDEADSMTSAAQQALRRTMEIYSHSTRFALACNMSSKIIEPIQSRCAILRFSKLKDEEVLHRLREVCEAESVTYTADGLEALIFTAEGDMRNALNGLQSTHNGFGCVTGDSVFLVCDQPHPLLVKQMLDRCREGRVGAATDILAQLWDKGYAAQDIIQTIFKVCRTHDMSEPEKLEYLRAVGFAHMRVAEGSNTYTQLLGCVAKLCKLSTAVRNSSVA